MAQVTDPIILDSTGQAIKNSIDLLSANINRTASNIPYDSNLTIKGKIDEIDAKTAEDIPYSSGVSVKQKIDSMETDYAYNLTLINGWTGNVQVNVSTKNQVVAIQGYIDATNATSTTFCNASTNPLDCYNNKLLPVSGQSVAIKANQAHEYSISFDNSGGWHAVISQKSTIAIVNVYARA